MSLCYILMLVGLIADLFGLYAGSGDAGGRAMERSGSTEKQASAVKGSGGALDSRRNEQSQGRKSAEFTGNAAHELQLLKAEKAVIAGEMQNERDLRIKLQSVRFSSACCVSA